MTHKNIVIGQGQLFWKIISHTKIYKHIFRSTSQNDWSNVWIDENTKTILTSYPIKDGKIDF